MTSPAATSELIPRPVPFWAGAAGCLAGIGENVWQFGQSAPKHFNLAGMPMGAPMWAAMAVMAAGLAAAAWGLMPRRFPASTHNDTDASSLGAAGHRPVVARGRLIAVLSLALLVDQMKPATLAFIEPGMRTEYHLGLGQIAVLPTCALAGTVAGSLLWGQLADRFGRRAALLLAALLFITTTGCSAMPTFAANVAMCVVMGIAAGGLMPIVYTLMSELLPRSSSGVLVLQAGLVTVAGYLAASGLATVLIPLAGWRIMWFAELPLVLPLVAAHRWVPEPSRVRAAQQGSRAPATIRRVDSTGERTPRPARAGVLFGPGYRDQTLVIGGYAVSWGVIYWGFLTFLPTVLGQAGLGVPASRVLLLSSLASLPGTVLAAWLYSHWSSRLTMAAYAALTVVSLAALAVVPIRGNPIGVAIVMAGLLTGSSAVIAVIGPYAAQVYPTRCRGLGSGMAAACGKSGGLFGPPVIAVLLAALPIANVAIITAAPLAIAAAAIATRGREVAKTTQQIPAEPDTTQEADDPQLPGRAAA